MHHFKKKKKLTIFERGTRKKKIMSDRVIKIIGLVELDDFDTTLNTSHTFTHTHARIQCGNHQGT